MGKKQPEKLMPVTSQATYPTLIEVRRDGGFLLKSVAAAVLATGLSGCGQSTATSGVPARDGGDAAPVDARLSIEVSGAQDLIAPDRLLDAFKIDGVPFSPDGPIDTPPMSVDFDSGVRVDATDGGVPNDAPDAARPDLGSPDRIWIMDGTPVDTSPPDTLVRRDAPGDTRAPDASTDTEADVK
jgi:hypothetical protein